MTATGVWSYTLDNNDPAVQALNGLATLTDTLTVQTVDGTAQVITVTIHAQNDTPTVTGDITGNVVEAGGVNNGTPGTPTATGNVDSDDVDNPDDTWQAVAAGTAIARRLRHLRGDRGRDLDLHPRRHRPRGAGAQRRRHAAGHLQRGDVGRHLANRHRHYRCPERCRHNHRRRGRRRDRSRRRQQRVTRYADRYRRSQFRRRRQSRRHLAGGSGRDGWRQWLRHL